MDHKNVCIACLASDTRLHDMYRYGLVEIYEDITSIQITADESNYQHYLCGICSTQLLKCVSFKEKCQRAQTLMSSLGSLPVQEVDREAYQLSIPFVVQTIHSLSLSPRVDYIKEEYNNVLNYDDDGVDDFKDTTSFHEDISEVEVKFETMGEENEIPINNDYEIPDDNDIITDDDDKNKLYEEDIEVVYLSREEQIAEVQRRKESTNYLTSMYKCEKCFKGFMTDVTYANHMVRHDVSSGAYECSVCGLRRSSAGQLRLHELVAHSRQFRCLHCTHLTKSLLRAREHRASHTGSCYDCSQCGKKFRASTSYLSHVRLQHPTQDRCPLCHKRFLGATGLNMHMKKAHRNCKEDLTEYICKECNVTFSSEDALERHLAIVSGTGCKELRSCGECGFGFDSESLLQEHIDTVHAVDESAHCDICKKRFSNKRTLTKHIQRCHLGTSDPGKKNNEIDFICEVCGSKCSSAVALIYHQRTHTGEKPYQCPDCPKTFRVPQGLKIHSRTHTGERPFKCEQCPKAFKNKAALNRHDRVHTGARPYTCSHCLKSFSQSNSMKLHILTVHLKLPAPYRNRRKNIDS